MEEIKNLVFGILHMYGIFNMRIFVLLPPNIRCSEWSLLRSLWKKSTPAGKKYTIGAGGAGDKLQL